MRNILIVCLLFILTFSACIQTKTFLAGFGETKKETSQGISTTEFFAIPSQTFSGKSVKIYMTLKNVGGEEVERGLVCLLGENFPGSAERGFWETEDKICKKLRTLKAPNPLQNMPGGETTLKWNLKAPFLPKGIKSNDMFLARVFYEYSTKASFKLFALTESERITMKQRGETIPTFKVDKTKGPVDISVEIKPWPIIVVNGEEVYINLKIILRNVGEGTVFDASRFSWEDTNNIPVIGEDELNKIYLSIRTPNEVKITCDEEKEGNKYYIELFMKEATISCDVHLKDPSLTTKKEYPILIEAKYGYYFDEKMWVRVEGREETVPTYERPEREEREKALYVEFENNCLKLAGSAIGENIIQLEFLPGECYKDSRNYMKIKGSVEWKLYNVECKECNPTNPPPYLKLKKVTIEGYEYDANDKKSYGLDKFLENLERYKVEPVSIFAPLGEKGKETFVGVYTGDPKYCTLSQPACRGTKNDCEKICGFEKWSCEAHCEKFTTLDAEECKKCCEKESCNTCCSEIVKSCEYCKRMLHKLRVKLEYEKLISPPKACFELNIPIIIKLHDGEEKQITEKVTIGLHKNNC
jgi:hypothetical protein